MAYTVSYPTSGPLPNVDDLATWLTEQGEAFERDGDDALALRALPVRLVHTGAAIKAQVDVNAVVPLSRLIRLLFDLSFRLGADVRLAGAGEVNRAAMWLRFADEQDRLRIADALSKAAAHNNRDDILHAFWGVLGSLGSGRDLRWDASRERIVEMKEVGSPDGLTMEEAAWHEEDAESGDMVAIPVTGDLHILAWRWLSEAYPSLASS